MKTIVKIFLVLYIISSTKIYAQVEKAPVAGEPKDFSIPPVNTFKLDNGLSVTLVRYGNIPKVAISVIVRSGNLNEAQDEIWLADFTGNLMKEGTMTKTGQQIADEAAEMGGNLTVSTGVETTGISGDVLSEFAPEMLKLVADVVMNPSFPDKEVSRLKNDMIRNLNIQKAQPSNIAFELFSKVLYPDHPYGRLLPDQSIIESFTSEKANRFYDENFGALRSHVYVVGAFDEEEIEKTIRESFKTWVGGKEPEINIPEAVSRPMIYFADRPGAPQSVLNIGLPAIDPSNQDYLPMMLTNGLLGGSFTSRITKNIREEKGYTYSPYSQVASRYRTAYWMQFAEVGTEVTVPSIKEIFYEIKRLSDETVTEGELTGIKNYMSGLFVLRNSTLNGIIGQLAFINLHGLDISYLNNYVRNIHAITAADVQNIMKKYINPSNMTIVIAGDRNKIGKEIAQFGKISD